MKKIIFTFIILLSFSNGFAAEVIRIYNQNPKYSMFINYQACFRDLAKNTDPDMHTCLLPIFNVTIPKGKPYIDVTLPDDLDYARLVDAYDIDGEAVIAQGEFFQGLGCESWPRSPSVSLDNRNSRIIHCTRN